jgi:hypothetical protein
VYVPLLVCAWTAGREATGSWFATTRLPGSRRPAIVVLDTDAGSNLFKRPLPASLLLTLNRKHFEPLAVSGLRLL